MKNILLLTHFGWGESLIYSIERIIGKVDFVKEIKLTEVMTLDEYKNLITEYLDTTDGKVLVIVDMFGGTPSTVAALLTREYPIEVICGLNSPVLISACSKILYEGEVNIKDVLLDSQNSIFSLRDRIGGNEI